MLKLKIVLGNSDVRRVTLKDPVSFAQLLDAVKALVGEASFHVQYVDEENELIRIASQEDLDEAMLIVEEQNWKCLRVVLKYLDDEKAEPVIDLPEEVEFDVFEEIVEEVVEEKPKLMEFGVALNYLLNLYSEVKGDHFDGVLTMVVDMLKGNMSYEAIVESCKLVVPEFCDSLDWVTIKLACQSLAAMVHLIEGGDLHNVRLLVPVLVKYGFPLQRPFKFNDFKVTLAELLDVSGMPEDIVLIRNALLVFADKINIPEDIEDNAEPIHENYRCDGCGVKPIIGNRYHCHQCEDYDLCQNCEDNHVHDQSHDMLKIRRPIVEAPYMPAPLHPEVPLSVSCIIEEPVKKEEEENKADVPEEPIVEVVEEAVLEEKEIEPEFKVKLKRGLQSKFVEHVGLDNGDVVEPGSLIIKTWKVLNNGTKDWPIGTRLVFLNGDRRLVNEKMFETAVASSGETVEISAVLNAPERPGNYRATFRLSTAKGRMFGNKFWVEVNVLSE